MDPKSLKMSGEKASILKVKGMSFKDVPQVGKDAPADMEVASSLKKTFKGKDK